ncbi:uncharacterized protein A1O5_03317 [Cladophialophora psammophila CBS 110553]|uniref:Ubiquitin-like protease family profile domain-containing protein n=1 Tax=Cladophialophora psammophila CBS 110553 TaxID=1182543 RepID=W9X9E3_9EURO|nr:uncharacterized protein A1O5_03317 [Cladophialophora psammophila CBS 110553]EXJ73556.1 hypothetical protein A1O5_03317 [Cladophialophora psammophila CBS 110553]
MASSNSDSGSEYESENRQLTSTEEEVIALFRRLLHLVASDATIDLGNLEEFSVIIRQLCEEGPEIVDVLATTIQEERSTIDSLQQEQDKVEKSISHNTKRTRLSSKDLTYRPPKSTKDKTKNPCPLSDSGLPQTSKLRPSVEDSTANKTQRSSVQNTGVNLDRSSEDDNSPRLEKTPPPNHQQGVTQDVLVRDDGTADGRGTAVEASNDTNATIETTEEAQNHAENTKGGVLSRPSMPLAKSDPAVLTPTKPVEGTSISPQTEEIYRERMLTPLESIASPAGLQSALFSHETNSFMDLIIEAVGVIHQLKKYPDAVSADVHSRILQTHRRNNQETASRLNLGQRWSDGSMWIRILENGSARNQKGTILSMIEYMGFWEWYDEQIQLAMKTIRTRKGKLVDHKGAATYVLDSMQNMSSGAATRGKWISGVGRVTIENEGNTADISTEKSEGVIATKDQQLRRQTKVQLSRGQKLSKKLVKELSLGILFSPKIWEYTKMEGKQLDELIRCIQADQRRMQLLGMLGTQLERLVGEGQPDLHALYDGLRQQKLVSQKELEHLRVAFALDSDPMPKGILDVAVRRLIGDVSMKVLGKHKLENIDAVAVNNTPVTCDTFDRLRYGEWLNDEMINLAMNISDKPDFVKHGYSVPLDKVGKTRMTTPINRPLAAWARRIKRLREGERNGLQRTTPLVYFCPLNHRGAHFTLLEINDQERVIRHYDSMADRATINGSGKQTRVARLVEEEFTDLKYSYIEAPTPQQAETWSCGIRVIWNFKLLSNGLSIGGWDIVLDPERIKMELVEGFHTSVQEGVMSKYMNECGEPSSDSEQSCAKQSKKRCRMNSSAIDQRPTRKTANK